MTWMTKAKPYNALNAYYRDVFGGKVFKVSLNGGFTCPNKDGTAGIGGCAFCSAEGSGDFAGDPRQPLAIQFHAVCDMMRQKWPDAKYIAYFQANTNTYGSVEQLRQLYDEALQLDDNIIGLAIATRCDALDSDIYDLLSEFNHRTHLQIELGLQTIHPATAAAINRGHDLDCFTNAANELVRRGIETVVHIINGLPGETKQDMLATIDYVNSLGVHGIKIHMLHVMKHTAMGHSYTKQPFPILTRAQYVDIVCDQIERLDPSIVIHRLTGDAPSELLLAPAWTRKKFVVMNEIDKELRRRNTHQGSRFNQK